MDEISLVNKCPKCQSAKVRDFEQKLLYCEDCTWCQRIWQKTTVYKWAIEEWTTLCCNAAYIMRITLSELSNVYLISLYGYYTKGTRDCPDEIKVFKTKDEAMKFMEILMKELQNKPHVKYHKLGGESGSELGVWVSMEDSWLTDMFTNSSGHARYII